MSHRLIDPDTWPRKAQYDLFRSYERPHYAVTARIDVTHLLTVAKPAGYTPFRACLFAIGAGVHGVPELRTRFQGDRVTEYTTVDLSVTVPADKGSFNCADLAFSPDFATFDWRSAEELAAAAERDGFGANTEARQDLVYLSCLPWLDYTAINNAMRDRDDCIPRVSWGRFTETATGQWSMAMTLEVHHALVDGAEVAAYFAEVQRTLDAL